MDVKTAIRGVLPLVSVVSQECHKLWDRREAASAGLLFKYLIGIQGKKGCLCGSVTEFFVVTSLMPPDFFSVCDLLSLLTRNKYSC